MRTINFNRNPIRGSVQLPSSKSIANRMLIIKALSGDKIAIKDLQHSDDTLLMQSYLGEYRNKHTLNAQNAGTVFRFLAAFLAIQHGEWILTGNERMLKRPIKPVVDGLLQLGADVHYLEKEGYPPLRITGCRLDGGKITVDGSLGSQFISALLLIAPALKNGLELAVTGPMRSAPYIDMTVSLMRRCGADASRSHREISVKPGMYRKTDFAPEADWSAAAFFYEIAALSGNCEVTIPGLTPDSLQGDSLLPTLFLPLGVQTRFMHDAVMLTATDIRTDKFSFDFSGHPDLFIPIALTCAGAGIDFTASGVQNLRIKESDRIEAVLQGLAACGIRCDTTTDGQFFIPGQQAGVHQNTRLISSCGDHRVAMGFAALSTRAGKITIDDLDVAQKSFPDFAGQIRNLGFVIE